MGFIAPRDSASWPRVFAYLLACSAIGSSVSLTVGNVKCCLDLVGVSSPHPGDPWTPVGEEGIGGDPLSTWKESSLSMVICSAAKPDELRPISVRVRSSSNRLLAYLLDSNLNLRTPHVYISYYYLYQYGRYVQETRQIMIFLTFSGVLTDWPWEIFAALLIK